jgi:hypothetical protein
LGNQKPLFDRQHNGQKNKGQTSTLKLKIEKHELYEILAREPNYFGRGLVAYILNVEYICLSRSDIPDIVVPIMISFIENCCIQCIFGSYDDLFDIMLLLTKKLLSHGFLGVKFKSPLRKLKVTTMRWLTTMEYLFNKRPHICFACRNHNTVMTFYRVCNKCDMKKQELLTIPGRLSSPPCFNKVHVPRSLVLCVMFC